MNLFKGLFSSTSPSKECPRCLGKGHVDWDDIKRLKQELKWKPGSCAYCNGTGKVHPGIEENVPVDTSYLVTNLPEGERKRILAGNPEALERGRSYEDRFDVFIDQVKFLHLIGKLTPAQIAEFYMIDERNPESYETKKQELEEYFEKVIKLKVTRDQME
ncbi:hypothetical protein QEG73_22845 [Chitinophagaceae bacterium 26-R-25]|nr:hypothetical protein [Chitinophagaceae bacterium 26-R-25]